jgi:predicted Zn-dependent protease
VRRLAELTLLLAALAALPGASRAQSDGAFPTFRGPPPADAVVPDMAGHVDVAWAWISAAFDAVREGDQRAADENLSHARGILGDALVTNPYSRDAAVAYGVAMFYQAYYLDGSRYPEAIEFLTRILEVDPYAADAARYLASAYAQLGDGRNVRYYARYVEAVSADAELIGEMSALVRPFEEAFLEGWYDHADYYERAEAKVTLFNPKTFQIQTIVEVTPQFEMSLGSQGFARLGSAGGAAPYPELQAYLQRLVDRLEAQTPGPPIHNVVEVVDSPEPNAAALPGHIRVHTGLIRFADSEAELVAVLAHELGHVYAHHAARLTVSEIRSRMTASALLSLVHVENELYRQLIDIGVDVGIDLLLKGYSRQYETEADRYATHLAFNAGYNPTFMTSLFVRLYQLDPSTPFRLTATHPPTSERIERTTAYLEDFPLEREMQVDSREFQELKRSLGG